MRDNMLEKIEEYLKTINIELLSMEELEHYTKIFIAIENKRLDDIQKNEIINSMKKEVHLI